jgi:hypothetical protein
MTYDLRPPAPARSDPPYPRNPSLSRHCPGVTRRAVLHPPPCPATSPQARRYFSTRLLEPPPRSVGPSTASTRRSNAVASNCTLLRENLTGSSNFKKQDNLDKLRHQQIGPYRSWQSLGPSPQDQCARP